MKKHKFRYIIGNLSILKVENHKHHCVTTIGNLNWSDYIKKVKIC